MTRPGWRRVVPWLVGAGVVAAVVVVTALIAGAVAGARPDPRDAPTITRSFYAEKNGAEATGRVCAEVVASTAQGVSVALSCSWPPAESRIADLLEGAGQ